MEIHSACDLLDDETDDSVAAYERLAFGRLSLADASSPEALADIVTPPAHASARSRQAQRSVNDISIHYRIVDDKFVQYLIQFSSNSQPFVSRYSELEHFHRQMICRFPELKTESAFPRKRFWGNFSPNVLKTRADQFCCYFHHLLNARNCIYRQSAIFRDFFISTQRSKYRQCLSDHDYESALNYLFPVQDFLECLEIICPDQLVNLSLICLCNWKAGQADTANLYSQKTLSFITSNAKTLSAKHYAPLVQECISIVSNIRQHHGDGDVIRKVEEKLLTMRASYTDQS